MLHLRLFPTAASSYEKHLIGDFDYKVVTGNGAYSVGLLNTNSPQICVIFLHLLIADQF